VLTSTAFGLPRYLPFVSGIAALFRARVVEPTDGELSCEQSPDWLGLRDTGVFQKPSVE
jgi:hypothetical protein